MIIRKLREDDLDVADRIFRLAFGTHLGIPDPSRFAGDTDYIRTRWRARPDLALAAEVDGTLVGTNFVTRWGTVGFFGPLTVRPDLWNRGVAKELLRETMKLLKGLKHAGLFTFPNSAKHLALYQQFGFWPRALTPVLSKPVVRTGKVSTSADAKRLRAICGKIFRGLDLTSEIEATEEQKLGATVVVSDGFAVCHVGAGTEAGSGQCYVKFGAAASARAFGRLLDACEAFAAGRGAHTLIAGVNLGREEAYRLAVARGFRAERLIGVLMHRPNRPAYHESGVFAIDDWR